MAITEKRRLSTLLMPMLLAGLWLPLPVHAGPSAKPAAAASNPMPGNPMELYIKRYSGLQKTGGLVVEGTAAGFDFEIYEGKRGAEYQFSSTFLPCDPTDTEGVVYLPKLSLVVMKTPDGKRFVLSETKQITFAGSKDLNRFLADNEKAAAQRIPAATHLLERLRRWYAYNFQNEKSYHVIFSDSQVKILQASLDGGTLGSLLLIPDWAAQVKDDAEGKSKVGGVLKRVDYVTDYKQIALDSLYRFVQKAEKKKA